ncbi:MAG: fimbrial protein [Plesiomonas shigelloides]
MKRLFFFIVLMLFSMSLYTYAGQATTQIPITATVRPSLCVINGNQPINFNFGLMSTLKVNGINYAQTKTVSVVCDYFVNKPIISVSGNILSNSMNNVLATNINDFGIALYQGAGVDDSYKLALTNGQSILRGLTGVNSANGIFTITAVPFSLSPSNGLNTGDFNASASIAIYYQ